MGIIIGKFRKRKSTYDILEKLENEITSIEEFGRSTEQFRKKIIGRFVILAILLYLVLASTLYVYYHEVSTYQKLICILAFPLGVWLIRKFLTWYYSRKLRKNEKKLVKLKEEKKKILDNVMENETYKVAKKILDKFGNGSSKKHIIPSTELTPLASTTSAIVPRTLGPSQTALRQRYVGPQTVRGRLSYGMKGPDTPIPNRPMLQGVISPRSSRSATGVSLTPSLEMPLAAPTPLPRGILPRDRSVLDKMMDYLVGDGPSNRYALICKKCFCHNGMALKEEFEYLSFRCCYCSHFNPAKKMRPAGPKFETVSQSTLIADSSESEKSDVDSDGDLPKPIVSEPMSKSPDTGKNSDFDKLSDIESEEIEPKMTTQNLAGFVSEVNDAQISQKDTVQNLQEPSTDLAEDFEASSSTATEAIENIVGDSPMEIESDIIAERFLTENSSVSEGVIEE